MPFDFCGTIADVMRSCYTTKARILPGEEPVTLRWYYAHPDAVWYPGWHAFPPASQDLDRRNPLTDPTNVGERTYQRKKKDWYVGYRPDGANGAEWHGSPGDFRLEFSQDRARVVQHPRLEDIPACVLARWGSGNLCVEGDSHFATAHVFRSDAGELRFEGESTLTIRGGTDLVFEGESTLRKRFKPAGDLAIEGESTFTSRVVSSDLVFEGESVTRIRHMPAGDLCIEGESVTRIRHMPAGDLCIEGESTFTARPIPGLGDLIIEGESLLTVRYVTGGVLEIEGGS